MIKEVFADNLVESIDEISSTIKKYPIITIDAEFPGTCAKPIGSFESIYISAYQTLRANTTLMNIIQIGLTLSNSSGEFPEISTYQFNFRFDLDSQLGKRISLDLLKNSNIDFEKNMKKGIEPRIFAYYLLTSDLINNPELCWVSFHGIYDFSYILKGLTQNLPTTLEKFRELMGKSFVKFYDLKYMLKDSKYNKRGLQDICNELNVEREGQKHQAGSDSLLTAKLFNFLVKEKTVDTENDVCKLFGLN